MSESQDGTLARQLQAAVRTVNRVVEICDQNGLDVSFSSEMRNPRHEQRPPFLSVRLARRDGGEVKP